MRRDDTAEAAVGRARADARVSLAIYLAVAVLDFALLLWWKLRPGGSEAGSLTSALVSSLVTSLPLVVPLALLLRRGSSRRLGTSLEEVQPARVVSQEGRNLVLDIGVDRVDVRVEGTRGRVLRPGDVVWVPRGGARPVLLVMREPGRFGRHTLWAAGR